MEMTKELYIAPKAQLLLFMPVEGIAYDDSWLRGASDDGDGGLSGPTVDLGGIGGDPTEPNDDGEEFP